MDRTSSEVDATKYGTEGAFFYLSALFQDSHIPKTGTYSSHIIG
jgi:hypothetical protein